MNKNKRERKKMDKYKHIKKSSYILEYAFQGRKSNLTKEWIYYNFAYQVSPKHYLLMKKL